MTEDIPETNETWFKSATLRQFICTSERPWRGATNAPGVIHPSANETAERDGDIVIMFCPNCLLKYPKL